MQVIAGLIKWIIRRAFRIELTGEDNIPDSGGCIACVNHISIFDPIVICTVIKRHVRFIAKQELFRIPVVGWYLKAIRVIPIKRGSGDIGAVKSSLKALKNGEVLGIFPTGTREKKHPDAPVKPGVALIALRAGVPVIPIHIDASYRIFSKVRITVGEEVDMSGYADRKLTQEELASAAEKIYSSIRMLGGSK